MTTWAELLDAMEAGLDDFPPVLPDNLPREPGPLPPALTERATRTLQRMAEVVVALEQHQAEIGQELTALSAARANGAHTAASAVPHFLDTKA